MSAAEVSGVALSGAALSSADDLRLTWVQPEDLIGHELAQAARDGRDATEIERRWYEAGGHPAPPRAGASPTAASARLRAVAEELLDELALLDSPLAVYEPTDLTGIRAMSTAWRSAESAPDARPQAGAPSPTDTPPSTNTPSRTGEPPQADAPSEAHAPNRTDAPHPADTPHRAEAPSQADAPNRTDVPRPADTPPRTNTPHPADPLSQADAPYRANTPSQADAPHPGDTPSQPHNPHPADAPHRANTPHPANAPGAADAPHRANTPSQAGTPQPTDTPPQPGPHPPADTPHRTFTPSQPGPHPPADVPPRTACGPQDLKVFGAAPTAADAPGHSGPPPHVPGALPRSGPATPVQAEAPNRPTRTDADHVEWSRGPGAQPPHPTDPLPHGGPTAPARPGVSDGPHADTPPAGRPWDRDRQAPHPADTSTHTTATTPAGPYRDPDGKPARPTHTSTRTGSTAPAHPGAAPAGQSPLTVAQLHAAWLGRAVGCLLGKPVEKLPLAGIRALAAAAGNWPLRSWFTAKGVPAELTDAYPWNRRSAPTSLAENIDGMPEDDDLNYPLLNLLLLQRHGREFTTGQVARLWLDELPAGRTFTAERVAYGNLLHGIEPPHTAVHRNPFREWIGAAIRADVHGWTNPGDPVAAAEQAYRDAVLTHTGNGVYGAMFVAATVASAAGQGQGQQGQQGHGQGQGQGQKHRTGADVHACLRAGLSVVPPRSRLADAVRLGIAVAGEHAHTDFEPVVDLLHSALGHYHWVHVVPNTALLAAALTHADGDFTGSICRAVSGGWDTDSNGATAGSVAGLLAGHPDRLPERWTGPLKNRLATSVGGFDGIGFDTLAELTHPLAAPAPAPEEALHP
ncbi:ADP-ribosylglycohydrolase family protein [Streptomyces sp. SID1121]|uniref:ADP-ribosylglycohydrolase family protein n=1 Tax=Streptomyces sp. SID1121 TaxID=3425888 RepID=UPI00405771D1